MARQFVILTWHSVNIRDNSYAGNDLVAFETDICELDRRGWTILPLERCLDLLARDQLPERAVALTADDGAVLDFKTFDHPTCGPQRSLFSRLETLLDEGRLDRRHQALLSVFVIASPEARAELDQKVTGGLNLWSDDWWSEANRSGLIQVESHSWDHNHDVLERTAQRDNQRGDFRAIATAAECRVEVDQASAFIGERSGRRPHFFAYPYGQSSDYLREVYLPSHGPGLGLRAALSCAPEPVTATSNVWDLPRFVCGRDWNSPEAFGQLLDGLSASG